MFQVRLFYGISYPIIIILLTKFTCIHVNNSGMNIHRRSDRKTIPHQKNHHSLGARRSVMPSSSNGHCGMACCRPHTQTLAYTCRHFRRTCRQCARYDSRSLHRKRISRVCIYLKFFIIHSVLLIFGDQMEVSFLIS